MKVISNPKQSKCVPVTIEFSGSDVELLIKLIGDTTFNERKRVFNDLNQNNDLFEILYFLIDDSQND